jgi:3',5'-cyclic AMP phosphodiesterase CpdA
MRRIVFTLGLLVLGICFLHAQKPELKFGADKTFKIVQFTDVHWIYNDSRSDIAGERMNEVLDAEKPDFVIYTGDIIFGKPAKESLLKALEPLITRKIPFAVTWGNHDDEQGMSRQELFDLIKDIPNNLTSTVQGVTGVTNFVLPVKSADGKKESAVLYVFDSNSYSTLPKKVVDGYGWIALDQIDWYTKTSKEFTAKNGGQPLPSLAFFHIPLPEYHEAVLDEKAYLVGTRKEVACAPKINTGLGASMLQAGDVMGVFVGHDHVNDYVVNWRGILLGYGRYTGGSTVYHDIPQGNGARIIELTEGKRAFKTWERIAGGKIINEVNYPSDFIKED